jgi:hypothetical protein
LGDEMQYLCLGNRDKKHIEIIGISECEESKSNYKRNIPLISLNLTEYEFYKIKLISEKDIMNKELLVIQAESFLDARKIMFENNYKNIPSHSSTTAIKINNKFVHLENQEKNSMIQQKNS